LAKLTLSIDFSCRRPDVVEQLPPPEQHIFNSLNEDARLPPQTEATHGAPLSAAEREVIRLTAEVFAEDEADGTGLYAPRTLDEDDSTSLDNIFDGTRNVGK